MLIKVIKSKKSPMNYQGIQKRSNILRYLKYGLMTSFSFLVTASVLHKAIPSPEIPANVEHIGAKYTYYEAHKDDYNTLIFGSSRVHNQISPQVIDDIANAEDIEINSYNFGIPALREIHTYVLLRSILQNPPEDLEWVLIEVTLGRGYEPFSNVRTTRTLYWHTPRNTKVAVDYILESDETALNKAILISSHVLPTIYQKINVGRIFNQVLPINSFSAEVQHIQNISEINEGFFGISNDEFLLFRENFLANQSQYQEDVDTLIEHHKSHKPFYNSISRNQKILLQRMVETVEAAGAKPIFVIPPTMDTASELYDAYEMGLIPTLFAYNNPIKYPQFYSVEHRHDRDHMNIDASLEFSKLLTQDFIQLLRETK